MSWLNTALRCWALPHRKVLGHDREKMYVQSTPQVAPFYANRLEGILKPWLPGPLWKIQICWQTKRGLKVNFIIYDLEATCWRGRPPHGVNEVIEIGAYKVNQLGKYWANSTNLSNPLSIQSFLIFGRQLTSISTKWCGPGPRTFPLVIQEFMDWINVWRRLQSLFLG